MFDAMRAIIQRNGRYRRVFGSAEGQWVLNDLLRVAGVGRPVVHVNAEAALAAENRKFLALHIASIINLPDAEIMRRAQTSSEGDASNVSD
jgi:hypothetical protein